MSEHPGNVAGGGRGRFDGIVLANDFICREHYRLRVRVTGPGWFPPTRPGQFVQLGCRPPAGAMDEATLLGEGWSWCEVDTPPRVGQFELTSPAALLRRPFSLAGRGDDADGAWIEIIHRVVGAGTAWLASLAPGDAVDLIGPLGNSFEPPADRSLALLVGGGVGLPPMFYLAEALHEQGWQAVALIGAMTRDLLAVTLDEAQVPDPEGLPTHCVAEFARLWYPSVVTTDDGSVGLRGRITDGLARVLDGLPRGQLDQAVVFTCGPELMMRAAGVLARRHGVPCQACLEQAMACGMGTCQSCVVRIEEHEHPHATTSPSVEHPAGRPWRYRLACTDGPVFDARRVVW
ncbi:MAG: dihydroorotate dehydrogenase electron transfer subunit [Phycisphaeraceae bacterium]